MIARIEGTLVEVQQGIIEIALPIGLTYELLTPAYLSEALEPRRGEPLSLITMQWLEALHQGTSFVPRLIGFERREHRRLFELLTGVKGLGPRRVLRAMAIEPALLVRAIAEQDTKALIALPEIGRKLAQTMVLELAEKVAPMLDANERAALDARSIEVKGGLAPAARETIAALESLGEAPGEAERIVRRVLEQDPGASELDAAALLQRALSARSP